jgi:hypothetical protein
MADNSFEKERTWYDGNLTPDMTNLIFTHGKKKLKLETA